MVVSVVVLNIFVCVCVCVRTCLSAHLCLCLCAYIIEEELPVLLQTQVGEGRVYKCLFNHKFEEAMSDKVCMYVCICVPAFLSGLCVIIH